MLLRMNSWRQVVNLWYGIFSGKLPQNSGNCPTRLLSSAMSSLWGGGNEQQAMKSACCEPLLEGIRRQAATGELPELQVQSGGEDGDRVDVPSTASP